MVGCCRYYSATIIQMSGVQDDHMAIWLAAATAFTNFMFTLVGVWLVERVGRRKLTLGSILGEESEAQTQTWVLTKDCNKDGRLVSTSLLCREIKPKYP